MTGNPRSLPKKKRPRKLPCYLHHKATGQARRRLNGKDHHLGAYGSEESRVKYGELIANISGGVPLDPIASTTNADDPGPSVADLCVAFRTHAKVHYSKNGKTTGASRRQW